MGFHNLVNTRYFSEAAIDFRKNGGMYTRAPRGSKDYLEYWKIQDERCRNGYKVGDLWIPGRYYGYLNFSPMYKVPDEIALIAYREAKDKNGKVSVRTADKIMDFPRFWEIDYEWWNFKHIAWNGGTFMGINSPGGKHVCALKTRGCGFSYKEAWDGVYNYNFIPGSKSYYFAAMEQFLTVDGILNKSTSMLDFINEHIPYWKQNRQKKNTLMHQRASYLDEFGTEHGTGSEIIGTIINDPNKTRGKRGRKITFEEAGSFPHLKKALEVALGSLRDGSMYVGQASVFGTGGEEGVSLEGLESVFSNPDQWDMLEFPNIFEPGMAHESCGYFVPCYRANNTFIDEHGNIDLENAIKADDEERAKKAKSSDPRLLDARKAEYPRTPSEALQRWRRTTFNIAEIDQQIRKIKTSQQIQSLIRYGDLVRDPSNPDSLGGVRFVPKSKEAARPILDYPHKNTDNLDGCLAIYERPYREGNYVPPGIYKVVFDPYVIEEAEDKTSLFAIQVWKLDNNIDPSFSRLMVADWAGRPSRLDRCYEILFMLCDYYNCTAQGELPGGGQGVIDYARKHKFLHKLDFEPEMLDAKEYTTAAKVRNRSYLMAMPVERKRQGLTYLEQWHTEVRGHTDKGHPILNIHHIYSLPFLLEMRNAGDANADRLSAGIVAQYSMKSNVVELAAAQEERNGFFTSDRVLFGGHGDSLEFISPY